MKGSLVVIPTYGCINQFVSHLENLKSDSNSPTLINYHFTLVSKAPDILGTKKLPAQFVQGVI